MRKLIWLIIPAVTLFACRLLEPAGNKGAEHEQQNITVEGGAASVVNTIPTMELSTGWTKIEPGGETRCAHDTPFAFWVRPGDPQKLLLFFQGGGGCWNYSTCAPGSSFYDQSVDSRDDPQFKHGIFSLDNPENPFQNHTMVYVPSCNGDVYWGDNVQTYTNNDGDDITVFHRGFVNGRAALEWAATNVIDPTQVFVTGCSAGSMGSLMFTPYVIEQYPEAQVGQLGDSLAFIFGDPVNMEASYGAAKNIPDWIPELDAINPQAFLTGDYYAALASHYPQTTFAQYNTQADSVQILFYSAVGGGTSQEFEAELAQTLSGIHARVDNFRSFTAEGDLHCILPRDEFYHQETAGTRLVDWMERLVNGRAVDNVQCPTCGIDTRRE